ncbi:hypothetical protein MUY27_07435 [Mucilaginibacter sp. RS28]|uniref:Damage-inducible protein DinB n=1 Tax=Mucilaginibacter straminoryzae TaxID=2932774 RepID=A0A9X2B8J8_9SPHI|nr:DinB family protein [Mucilaginibacter straminoryzae]MCJ8209536.1 hypothetical protein [Mucilaginibacter straminoryzae]
MKDYFLKLLAYDYYANKLILQSIKEMGNPTEPIRLMSHTLGAQQVWLGRCVGDPNAQKGAIWPEWEPDDLYQINEENHQLWVNFLNRETDLNRKVSYVNSKGDSFSDTLSDILAHLVNHGTHHRAQIGQLLKTAELDKLPVTDYIFFIRNMHQSN